MSVPVRERPRAPRGSAPASIGVIRTPLVGSDEQRHWARRWGVRILVAVAAGIAAAVLYVFVVKPVLPAGPPPRAAPAPEAVVRPASIPERVPQWAWQLHLWHLQAPAERGPRPEGAPASVPAWYWDFRRWRISLAPEA